MDPPFIDIAGKYAMGPIIGGGSFGVIYSGTDIVTGEKVAIKVEETLEIDHPILQQEAKIIRFLQGGETLNLTTSSWVSSRKRYHCEYREGRGFTGTTRYASINAHYGVEQTRRDDMESVGYMLIYFLRGSLPWQGRKMDARKGKRSFEKHCGEIPAEFVTYLKYCQSLQFDEMPDYACLKKMLLDLYKREGYVKDKIFDWDVLKAQTHSSALKLAGTQQEDRKPVIIPAPVMNSERVTCAEICRRGLTVK